MDCAICLEPLDIREGYEYYEVIRDESKIIRLPCKCASSFYHTACLLKMLDSGNEKNFCPCCRTKYFFLFPRDRTREEREGEQNEEEQQAEQQVHDERETAIQLFIKKKLKFIFFLHMVSNSIQNIFFWFYATSSVNKNNVDNKWIFISIIVKIFMNLVFCFGAFENDDFSHGSAIGCNNMLQSVVIFLFLFLHKWQIDLFYLGLFCLCLLLEVSQFIQLIYTVKRLRG